MNRFDDDTLTRIIRPGVTGIFCQPMLCLKRISDQCTLVETSYDHKRCLSPCVRFADVDGTPADVAVWDFVIHRGDGERVRLHPSQMKKKVEISMMGAPIPTAADGPQAGRGLSDGRYHLLPSSADAPIFAVLPPRGDGADWRGWQDWRGAWSSIFRKTATASTQNHHP